MSEISNKTLVGLLVVAIVISLAGTFISLNKLGQLQSITGFDVNVSQQSGTTWGQTLGAAQLILYNNDMNFTSGQVDGNYSTGHDFCTIETDGTVSGGSNDFSGSSLGAGSISAECDGWTKPSSFVLENAGNTVFTNVTMATSNGNTGYQSTFSSSVTNGNWTWRFDEEGDACSETYDGSSNIVGTAAAVVCGSFQDSPNTDDAFIIQMQIQVPEDAPAAIWSDTATFTGNV